MEHNELKACPYEETIKSITGKEEFDCKTCPAVVCPFPKVKEERRKENTMNRPLIISETLKNLGISPHLLGYHYLRYALELTMDDSSIIHRITKDLYPKIAQLFNTEWSRVERAIRHAVETAWLYGDNDIQTAMFGYSVKADKGKPTNGEFIATVADYILLTKGGE